jgi:hypothetical protein
MEELQQLLDQSGMSERDFCYVLSQMSQRDGGSKLSLKAFENMLNGNWSVPPGVVADAHQAVANGEAVVALIKAHPWIKNVSYKHFKYALDSID